MFILLLLSCLFVYILKMRQNLIFLFLFLIFGLSASDESEWESPHDWGIRSDLKRIRSLDSGVDIDTKQMKLDKPGSESDSEWENPYGWGSEGDLRSSCSVEMGIDMDAQLGVTFYKKLVNFLFKRKQHLVNEFDQNQHLIKIHLQITTEQLEKLAATENIREMDAIVWDVIELSRDGFIVEAKELIFTWLDYLHNLYLWIINSSSVSHYHWYDCCICRLNITICSYYSLSWPCYSFYWWP